MRRMAPEGVKVFNPAFDVTSRELVTALVTERGVVRPPFSAGLTEALRVIPSLRSFSSWPGAAF